EVFSHQDDMGIIDPVDAQVTDNNGHASVLAAPGPGMETLVTVIQPGYDLFTFDGVPTSRLGVPLSPAVPITRPSTLAAGVVTTAVTTLNASSKFVGDSRAAETSNSLIAVNPCSQATPF